MIPSHTEDLTLNSRLTEELLFSETHRLTHATKRILSLITLKDWHSHSRKRGKKMN